MEWRNGIGEGSDTIMDCRRYPCWNVGYVTEPDIRQGTNLLAMPLSWLGLKYDPDTQIFNASHMAPYDNPHATHDMILRFMGVNFSSIADGSARIPSSVGDDVKPVFLPEDQKPTLPPAGAGKTPEQDKAMWEGNLPSF